MHFPYSYLRQTLSGILALWSPDFPRDCYITRSSSLPISGYNDTTNTLCKIYIGIHFYPQLKLFNLLIIILIKFTATKIKMIHPIYPCVGYNIATIFLKSVNPATKAIIAPIERIFFLLGFISNRNTETIISTRCSLIYSTH